MARCGTLITFLTHKILPASWLNSNFDALKTAVNFIDATQIVAGAIGTDAHADMSAVLTPKHSATSNVLLDTANLYTATNVETALAEIAAATNYKTGFSPNALQLACMGISYDGRVQAFATGTADGYSGGGVAPDAPAEWATLAESRVTKATRAFTSVPYVECGILYIKHTSAGGTLTVEHAHGIKCFPINITVNTVEFVCKEQIAGAGDVGGWLWWKAYGPLDLS